jgi:hypothetical protein
VDDVRLGRNRVELEQAVTRGAVRVERRVAVHRDERADARAVAGSELLGDALVEVGQGQLRVVLKDAGEVHLTVGLSQILAGHVERVDEARCNHVTSVGVLGTTASDDLGTGLHMRDRTRAVGDDGELALRALESRAVHVATLEDVVEQRVPLDEELGVRRHQLVKSSRQNVRGNSH